MDRERIRKGAQLALVGVAVAAAAAAGVRYATTRGLAGADLGERVTVTPSSGPIGMRPFLEIAGYSDEREVTVYLCAPDNEEGPVAECAELGRAATDSRITSAPVPPALPDDREVTPETYLLRAGPDRDGEYPVAGEFRVVAFGIGRPPEARSLADVAPADLGLDQPREIARGAPCRTNFLPDGRLLIGQTIFDPATGVTVQITIEGAELVWSPDRDRLAVITPDRKEIRLAKPDGSDPDAVVREPRGLVSSVTWSPEGDRISYVARSEPGVRGGPGAPTVFLFNLIDGSTTGLGRGEYVTWSPSGDELAVETAAGVIEMSDPQGARQRLTEGRRPSWSPDGSLVAVVRPHADDVGEGWVTRPGTQDAAQLVEDGICGLAFSPDGRRMALVHREGESTTLVLRAVRTPEE